jgi:hypothetical protein
VCTYVVVQGKGVVNIKNNLPLGDGFTSRGAPRAARTQSSEFVPLTPACLYFLLGYTGSCVCERAAIPQPSCCNAGPAMGRAQSRLPSVGRLYQFPGSAVTLIEPLSVLVCCSRGINQPWQGRARNCIQSCPEGAGSHRGHLATGVNCSRQLITAEWQTSDPVHAKPQRSHCA